MDRHTDAPPRPAGGDGTGGETRRAAVGRILREQPTIDLEGLARAVTAAGHGIDGAGLRADVEALGFRPRRDDDGAVRFSPAPTPPAPVPAAGGPRPTTSSGRSGRVMRKGARGAPAAEVGAPDPVDTRAPDPVAETRVPDAAAETRVPGAAAERPTGWSALVARAVRPAPAEERTPGRLRDLSPNGRRVAVLLAVVLAVPFVVGLVRLETNDWMLTGDDALLGVRSLDVFSTDPPLVGQPSTSETAGGGVRTYHPGAIEMYVFAPVVAVVGGWGMVLGAAAANLASILLTAWVILRRAGPGAALGAVVLLALFERSVGGAVLIDPLSSNMWGIPLVAVLACCWAVADGDVRLLPVTALVASWAAQQHLAAVVPTLVLVLFALGALGVRRLRPGRAARTGSSPPLAPWLAGSAVVGVVCWLPVIIQQLTGDPGNITAVIEYSGVEGRSTTGLGDALNVAANSLWPVPALFRRGLTGTALLEPPGPLGTLVLVLVIMAAVGLCAAPAVPRRVRLLLGAGLALAVAGTFNASNIPAETTEALRINLHRWIWPASTVLVVGVLWALAGLFRPELARAGGQVRARTRGSVPDGPWGPLIAVVLAVVVVAGLVVFPGAVGAEEDPYAAGLSRDTLEAVRDDVGDATRVLIIPEGPAAELAVVPALTFALERDGTAVVVPERIQYYWGPQRGADEGWDVAYRVSSRAISPAGPEGELVASILVDPRLQETLDPLVAAAQGATPVINPKGDDFLAAGTYQDAVDARAHIAEMPTDPAAGLLDPSIVRMILLGGIDGLDGLDQQTLRRHIAVLADDRTVWTQSRLLVFRLTDAEAQTILDSQRSIEDVPQPR